MKTTTEYEPGDVLTISILAAVVLICGAVVLAVLSG